METLLPLNQKKCPKHFSDAHCTCHVHRLGEDVILCTPCSVVFLYKVRVARSVAQCCGCEENIYTRAEHTLEILSDETPDLLSLHKVKLIVPVKTNSEICKNSLGFYQDQFIHNIALTIFTLLATSFSF